jgi:hypothetical protein
MNDKRDNAQEREIVEYLFQSEHSFARLLKYVVAYFLEPLQFAVGKKDQILSENQIAAIFSNFEKILSAHTEFFREIHSQRSKWDPETTMIGPAFLNMVPRLSRYYVSYAENLMNAQSTLASLRKTDVKFSNFLAVSF